MSRTYTINIKIKKHYVFKNSIQPATGTGPSYRWLGLQREEPPHDTCRVQKYPFLNQTLDSEGQRETPKVKGVGRGS